MGKKFETEILTVRLSDRWSVRVKISEELVNAHHVSVMGLGERQRQ